MASEAAEDLFRVRDALDTLANTPITRGGIHLYPDDVCPAAFTALHAVLALHKPTAASVRAAILSALENS